MRKHEQLSDAQLRDRLADLEDEMCDARGVDRRFVERLVGEYEHEINVRAGRIDPYTGTLLDARGDDEEDAVSLPFEGRNGKLEVVEPATDAYHAHLDACERCRDRPFAMCVAGRLLLARTAASHV